MKTQEQMRAFLIALTELTREHGIILGEEYSDDGVQLYESEGVENGQYTATFVSEEGWLASNLDWTLVQP